MQEAFRGSWARESHLTEPLASSLRGLNHRFLDLAGGVDLELRRGDLNAALGEHVAPLSRAQRAAAADCPYALFDLRFQDDAYWCMRLQSVGQWRVADELDVDSETERFVQLALFYAWHVASSGALAAQLLLGMNADTAAAFSRMTLGGLPALAATEVKNLAPRFSHCTAYWSALIGAAARADGASLRRVQLYGLQLAAAVRLPTT